MAYRSKPTTHTLLYIAGRTRRFRKTYICKGTVQTGNGYIYFKPSVKMTIISSPYYIDDNS